MIASTFGSVLDMMCDKMSNLCGYMALIGVYPKYRFVFLFLIILDLVSHWMHMLSKIESGNKNHKTAKHPFLALYYHPNNICLNLLWGAEGLSIPVAFLYPYYITNDIIFPFSLCFSNVAIGILFILFALKQYTNVLMFVEACTYYTEKDFKSTLQSKQKK